VSWSHFRCVYVPPGCISRVAGDPCEEPISVTNNNPSPFLSTRPANGYTPGSLRLQIPCAEARHEPQPSLYKPFTGTPAISSSVVRPSNLSPLPASSAPAHQPSMSTAAAVRSPPFHRPDPAFDMRESSGITLPPIRAHSSRPSLELPSMKAILAAASSHLFSTDRHYHYSQPSSAGNSASLSSTFRSQTYSASTIARFENESVAHPLSMCEYLCDVFSVYDRIDAGIYRPGFAVIDLPRWSSTEPMAPASPEVPFVPL